MGTLESELAKEFYERGFCQLQNALPPDVCAAFSSAIEDDLKAPASPWKTLSLSDPSTWPTKAQPRVAEAAPSGTASFWPKVLSSSRLAALLDAIVGVGCWELNPNPLDKSQGPRHWYCPVTFPEPDPSLEKPPTTSAANGAGTFASAAAAAADSLADGRVASRPALFRTCAADLALQGPVTSPTRWQPVNRRRFLNKGISLKPLKFLNP